MTPTGALIPVLEVCATAAVGKAPDNRPQSPSTGPRS